MCWFFVKILTFKAKRQMFSHVLDAQGINQPVTAKRQPRLLGPRPGTRLGSLLVKGKNK